MINYEYDTNWPEICKWYFKHIYNYPNDFHYNYQIGLQVTGFVALSVSNIFIIIINQWDYNYQIV